MRNNFFGDTIYQPSDDIDVVRTQLADKGFTPTSADLESEADEQYLFGGELRDDDGKGVSFDGFESLETARAFAEEFVPADSINVLD